MDSDDAINSRESFYYTVEPLMKDTLNKEHLSIKDKSIYPNSYHLTSEKRKPLYKGQNSLAPTCPLFRGYTTVAIT